MYNDPCTKNQRSYIEDLRLRHRMSYMSLLARTEDLIGRDVKDLGELTVGEASEVIQMLEEL